MVVEEKGIKMKPEDVAKCVACKGNGTSSMGSDCYPCGGTGRNVKGLAPNPIAVQLAMGDMNGELTVAQQIKLRLEQTPCDTEEQYQGAGAMLKQCVAMRKQYDAKRKAITTPMNAAKREVDAQYKPILQAFDAAAEVLKSKLSTYQARAFADRQATMRKMQAAHTQGQTATVFALSASVGPLPSVQGVSTAKRWKWRCIDPTAVPRAYLQINGPALTEALRQGVKDGSLQHIPGIEWYQEETTAVRTKA